MIDQSVASLPFFLSSLFDSKTSFLLTRYLPSRRHEDGKYSVSQGPMKVLEGMPRLQVLLSSST